MTAVSHRPTPFGSGVAILLGAGVAVLLTDTLAQRIAIGGAVVGVSLIVAGGRCETFEHPIGPMATVAGLGAVCGMFVWGLGLSGSVHRIELLPGLVGTVLLGAGLRPISGRFARRFVSAGLASFVIGIAFVGIFEGTVPLRLLAATVAAVAAWDIAEHSIGLGEQLRSDIETRSVTLIHLGATTGYGAGLVVISTLLFKHGTTGLPLGTLVLLLFAAIILSALLYD